MASILKKVHIYFFKIYPIFLLFYLLVITLLFVLFSQPLIQSFVILWLIIPFFIRHPDIVLLFKEILNNLGIKSGNKSIDGEFSNFRQVVEKILKERNLSFNIKIIDDEKINVFAGIATIYITKGFVKLFPLNDKKVTNKILPVLGHELTHIKRQKDFIKELFLSPIILVFIFITILFLWTLFIGLINLFVFYYLFFLSNYLLIFYIFRRQELEADKGGFEFANDNAELIDFLKKGDKRAEKGYTLWDKFYELFDYHPHPVTRIKELEKMKDKKMSTK